MADAYPLTCPACGHNAEGPLPMDQGVYRCDECGARIAYGTVAPRVSVTPSPDERWITYRFEREGTVTEYQLDADLARLLVENTVSVLPRKGTRPLERR